MDIKYKPTAEQIIMVIMEIIVEIRINICAGYYHCANNIKFYQFIIQIDMSFAESLDQSYH